MESEGNVSEVQSHSWVRFICLAPGERPRKGQAVLWQAISGALSQLVYFAVLCTGYGKTLAACGGYAILRAQQRADRMLVLVPNDNLRKQWSRDAKANMKWCGVKILGAYEISKEARDVRYAEDRKAEVFVATYQQAMSDPGFWDKLMSVGKWFVVYDECHHLGVGGVWAKTTHNFDTACRLYLTATPLRTDGQTLVGVPRRQLDDGRVEYVPDVRIDYADALKERAVRPIQVSGYHYFVDVQLPDGTVKRITTESLTAEGIKDQESWGTFEQKSRLRYLEKFLSPILLGAVAQWQALENLQPGQHQVVVFAMSCKHAEHVTRVLNAMPDVGPQFADWIGDIRKDHENDAVMSSFSSGRLKCLVQIDKLGEGFDNSRCSVGVFLHLVKSPTRGTQQIGRLVRRNKRIRFENDRCYIFTSVDAPIFELAVAFEKAAELVEKENAGALPKLADHRDPRLVSIDQDSVVGAQFDRVEVHEVGATGPSVDAQKAARGAEWLRARGIPNVEMMPLSALAAVADGLTEKEIKNAPASEMFATVNGEHVARREQVKRQVGILARNVVTLRSQPAGEGGETRFERSLLGDTIKAIHSQWMRSSGLGHDAMIADELALKAEWVRKVNDQLLETRVVPGWLLV